ncbi:MAG: Spy/CpxP family protein refolding chaperone [Bryobacterales bacterium]|nr:Spy/CpxP family protein refolding chaperone [Bryobacterales bacterium]
MRKSLFPILLFGAAIFTGTAFADAPLKTALDLDMDQARQVTEIQSRYRKKYAVVRGEEAREERAMRRAKLANDAETMAAKEEVVNDLKAQMRQIKDNEDADIRKVLTPEQNEKFDAYIERREAMVGSSRDVRNHRP